MSEKVMFLFIDALSSTYINEDIMPNVARLARENYFTQMRSTFGFLAVGSAIFAGVSPNTANLFNQHVLRVPAVSHPTWMKRLIEFGDAVPSERISWRVRKYLFKLLQYKHLGVCVSYVPARLIDYFGLKPERPFTEEGCLAIPTLFDVLRRNNKKYLIRNEGLSLERSLKEFSKTLKKSSDVDFAFIKINSLDIMGHRYGSKADSTHKVASRIDCEIQRLVNEFQDDYTIIVMSDHGMSPVDNHINLNGDIQKLTLEIGRDFVYFIDSTVARFWFFNENAKSQLLKLLSNTERGHVLSKDELSDVNCDKIGEEHGQIIFALDEGNAFSPDFFHLHSPPLGMHGYFNSNFDSPIMIIINGRQSKRTFTASKNPKLTDIMPTVLEIMELDLPKSCEGSSLIV